MTEFKVGDRVEVINEEKARATSADVHKGEQGVVTGVSLKGIPFVNMDNDSFGEAMPWSIPKNGLKLIKGEIK